MRFSLVISAKPIHAAINLKMLITHVAMPSLLRKGVERDPPLPAQLPQVVRGGWYTHVYMWLRGSIHAYTLPVPPWPPAPEWQELKIDHSNEGAARAATQWEESKRSGTISGL